MRIAYTQTQPKDDLTDLGHQILTDTKTVSRDSLQIDRLNSQIEEIDRQLQDINDHIENARILLSGEVWIRSFYIRGVI